MYMYMYMYMYMCICICIYACIYVYMYRYIYMYLYIYIICVYVYIYMCIYVFMYHVYNVYYPAETCCPRRVHAINLTELSMSGCSAGQINTNDAASSEGPHELALGRDSQSCAVQVRWEHGLGKKFSMFQYLRLAMENSTLIFSHCQGATSSSLLIQLRPTLPHPLGQAFVWSMAHPAC